MRKTENIINRTGINKTECKKTGHSKENKIPGVWNGSLFFLIIILGITLGIFAGCKNIFVPEPPATPEAAGPGGGITVPLRLFTGSARSVMPGMEDLKWEITATSGGAKATVLGVYPDFEIYFPFKGTWDFVVKGTKENKELFTGTATENVSNSTVSISIPLSPGSGMGDSRATGTLSLPIELINVCNMNLTYRINDGEWVEVFEFGGSGKVSIFKNDLPVGRHTLDLYFSSNSDKGEFYFCTVAVNIWPGMTSDQWIKTNGEEYIDNGEFVITGEMVDNFVKTMGSVVFVDKNVAADTPGTGSIYAPVNSVSTAVEILRKADPNGKCNGTIMVSGVTEIESEIQVLSDESLTVKGTGENASITNNDGRVFKIIGGSLTLGENIILTGTVTNDNGGAVYVNGGTFTMESGSKITGSSAQNGGGVYVNGGEFEMNGTATLQGNKATTHGGGVHIFSDGTFTGTFTMNGGTIGGTAQNTAEYGGGVFVSGGIFNMNDGTISGNTVAESGGGVCISSGEFTMSGDAVISKNTAGSSGGGVFVSDSGEFTMEGGTIGGAAAANIATQNGGGVYIHNGTFTMSGDAAIRGNKASSSGSGGGVYVSTDGAFTMEGGTIGGLHVASANSSESGGGVYINGTFTMSGGAVIRGNIASSSSGSGGGVFVQDGTFTLSGSPNISGNYRVAPGNINNVYLANGRTITIGDGGLNTSARIGVTTAISPAAGTEVQITDTAEDGAESIFIPDAEGCIIMSKEEAVYLADSSSFEVSWDTGSGVQYGSFADAISALNTPGSGGTIILQQDIDDTNNVFGTYNNQPITFTGGTEMKPIVLDLNGKTIDRALGEAQEDGTVISVFGALMLKDSTERGKITGGNNNNITDSGTWGGGVCVQGGAFFTMKGGNISNNLSEIGGGGVYVCNGGSFTMTGGTIGGSDVNDANKDKIGGGGVFVNGEFTMSDGTITGNITGANGGGVAVTAAGTFTMSGTAVISANKASYGSGGGVYSAADFTMTGGTIGGPEAVSANSAQYGGGVFVVDGTFTMTGGTISANNADVTGGGVNLGATDATMTLKGGTISDNTASYNGGGVGVSTGSFTMTGGTLSGNTATSGNGGGVYVDGTNSIFFMHGNGTITNNTAKLGGGVYVSNSGSFEIGTSSEISPVISGNTKTGDSPNNVYLDNGKTLFINGILKKTGVAGNIGVSMATPQEFTSGWSNSGSTEPTFFFSDNNQYTVEVTTTTNGQDELCLVNPNLIFVKGGSCELNSQSVTISSFWISPYEVTQEEFESIMTGNRNDIEPNPSHFKGEERPPEAGEVQGRRPVENVRWYDAIVYCNLLSMKEGLTPCYTIDGSKNPDDWALSPHQTLPMNILIWNL